MLGLAALLWIGLGTGAEGRSALAAGVDVGLALATDAEGCSAPATGAEGGSAPAARLGPPAGQIYAKDKLFETIGTPTELPNKGPFNTLYQLGSDFAAVSSAVPGYKDYRGGRWAVREVTFVTILPTQFTNEEDLLAAARAGQITISDVVRRFECPLIQAKKARPVQKEKSPGFALDPGAVLVGCSG